MVDPAVLTAAFLAGLLGSGHCFSMCGGIAGSLGAISGLSGKSSVVWPAVQFNLGRLLGYAVLGALAGGMLGAAGDIIALKPLGRWLRGLTALLVALIGLRFLFEWRGLEFIERGGAGLWRRIAPLAARISRRHDWLGRLGLGICWGFLPCGLVYTVLLTSAATGSLAGGAATMFAFGLGTLPSMLGLAVAAPALSQFLADRVVRRIVGFSLLVLAAWMTMTLLGGQGGGHAQH
ncbi:MAG: sulfite exporter TauE/SafE family protein [Xanthomonadales bacterium]|nr:sulfite exporter TauE/SafE family protein [Xanthomonadales bacterium]